MTLTAFQSLEQLKLTIARLHFAAEGVLSLELCASDGAELPTWQPGAHIDVVLPNGIVRQYSLHGDHTRCDRWNIGILREPESRGGSSYIHDQLRQGDLLTVGLPRNTFGLVEADRYLFIAGGIGITPVLPMLRAATTKGKPWTLLYGGRSRRSMAFLEEIETLPGGDVHVVPQDERGLPDLQMFLGQHQPGTVVYCCGPGPLIDAVTVKCRTWRSGALYLERFTPSDKGVSKEKGSFEVELARSGRRLVIPPYRSILEVLEENNCEVTNSCRAGICGTCLVKVLSGVPQHLDDVLSIESQEQGDVMLVCVSRAESDLLVLDL